MTRSQKCWGIYTGKRSARKYFRAKPFPYKYPNISQTRSFFIPTCLWRWNRQCFETLAYKIQMPRRKHTTFRTRRKFGIMKSRTWSLLIALYAQQSLPF